MSEIRAIQSSLSGNYAAALAATEKTPSFNMPASPLAVPVETARTQVHAATMLAANVFPTHDNIYTVGQVSVRIAKNVASGITGIASGWGIKY